MSYSTLLATWPDRTSDLEMLRQGGNCSKRISVSASLLPKPVGPVISINCGRRRPNSFEMGLVPAFTVELVSAQPRYTGG